MKSFNLFHSAVFLALLATCAAARGQDPCIKLSEAEVATAVGTQLARSPSDACRFGRALKSFTIIIHAGDGPRFGDYAANARKEFTDTQNVPGIGENAIFFGANLAVKAKGDVVVIQMLMGKSTAEKIALSKAVAEKLIAHL